MGLVSIIRVSLFFLCLYVKDENGSDSESVHKLETN